MLRLLNQMFVEPKKPQVVMIDIAEDIAFLLRISGDNSSETIGSIEPSVQILIYLK